MSFSPPRAARTWGMACHLAAFAGILATFGNVLGPLVVWLVKKDEHEFVNDQGKESLNFQMTLGVAELALWVIALLLPQASLIRLFALALRVIGVVFPIIAAIQTNEGKVYRYPFRYKFLA
jgi:uncharacterized Tic20 family protein